MIVHLFLFGCSFRLLLLCKLPVSVSWHQIILQTVLLIVLVISHSGSAFLIQTVSFSFTAGAQIIDMMMLVIDVTKGIQTQTAECLVIGEITCDHMLVVLNKVDLLAENKRTEILEKVSVRFLFSNLSKTHFLVF